MEQFQERLARLAELSPEELDALEGELVAAFDAADESGDLENMQAYADALDALRAEKANRGAPGEVAQAPTMEAPPVAASAVTESDTEVPATDEPTKEPEVAEN